MLYKYNTMQILNTILDFIFPPSCAICSRPGKYICIECLALCRTAERPTESWVFPRFDYRDLRVKKCIWLLKYKGKTKIALELAMAMRDQFLEELSELEQLENFTNPLVIPIPLSRERLRERGFNQSHLLAKYLMQSIDERLELANDVLIKAKDTEHQARITDRNKRLKNVIGSYTINNKMKIYKRNIILIDDVTTTGATLKEARKVLKENGARRVVAFTVAH